jgi:hypothetical protein
MVFRNPGEKQVFPCKRKHLFSCDEDIGQLGNVGAPAQVLNAVPETFFSALRNSARLI